MKHSKLVSATQEGKSMDLLLDLISGKPMVVWVQVTSQIDMKTQGLFQEPFLSSLIYGHLTRLCLLTKPLDGDKQNYSHSLKGPEKTIPQKYSHTNILLGFPGSSVVKNPCASAGDRSSVPGLGKSPREGIGNPLQYSCLRNPMDRGAWRATASGVPKSRARVSD